MATPERSTRNNSASTTKTELVASLAEIQRQLERANEIENPLVRHFTREELWERCDELQAEIDEAASPPETP